LSGVYVALLDLTCLAADCLYLPRTLATKAYRGVSMPFTPPRWARFLLFRPGRQSSEQISSATVSGGSATSDSTALHIEELECDRWTKRKLKIHTSPSGYIIIQCFGSAEGPRLKGSGSSEPDFDFSSLKLKIRNATGFDELKLFEYEEGSVPHFMSHEFQYPEHGRLLVMLSLELRDKQVQGKLWF
jgi:hypothetical protein